MNIGDSETHSDYYWYGNLAVGSESIMNITNENFFLYGHYLNVSGDLNLYNSTIHLNWTSIDVNNGFLRLYNSTIIGNGSVYLKEATLYSYGSAISQRGDDCPFTAMNSTVYFVRSRVFGQETSAELNYDVYRYYNDTYQSGGRVDLQTSQNASGYPYELLISIKYEYMNTSHPASVYLTDENRSEYIHFNQSNDVTESNFTLDLPYLEPDPIPEIDVESNESDLMIYSVNVLAIANDTYYLFGPAHFDLYMNGSTMYSVDSEFDLNDVPIHLQDGLMNPDTTGIYLYRSSAYVADSGSDTGNITLMPFITTMSTVHYFAAVNVSYEVDGEIRPYNGYIDLAGGNLIRVNATLADIFSSVFSSSGLYALPVWTYSSIMNFTGNYEIKIFNRTEYFSVPPFPDMGTVAFSFIGSVTLPLIHINFPSSILTGVNYTVEVGIEALYASTGNLSVAVSLAENFTDYKLCYLHLPPLRIDSFTNLTVKLHDQMPAGVYRIFYETNSSGILFAYQYSNVIVREDVNVSVHYRYYYARPFTDVDLSLELHNPSSEISTNDLAISFLSQNITVYSDNLTLEIPAGSYYNRTFSIGSSENITSAIIRLGYSPEMYNSYDGYYSNIRFLPLFSRYAVRIEEVGSEIYPLNISIDKMNYTVYSDNDTLMIPNGTYSIHSSPVSGYSVQLPGYFAVNGSSLTLYAYVSRTLYNVSFISDMPSGWSLYVDGQHYHNHSIMLPNGTYSIEAIGAIGYRNIYDSISVKGNSLRVYLNFTRSVYTLNVMVDGSKTQQQIDINGTVYNISGDMNISTVSGEYRIIGLNSTYLRTNFSESLDLFTNTTITVKYYRPNAIMRIHSIGYSEPFAILINGSEYMVVNGSELNIPFGIYAISMTGIDGYRESYASTMSIDTPNERLNITFSRCEYKIIIRTGIASNVTLGNYSSSTGMLSVSEYYGTYNLTISRVGYDTMREKILIGSNETLNFSLKIMIFAVKIHANIKAFVIRAGNQSYRVAGDNFTLYLPYGYHIIYLTKDGYEPSVAYLNITENETFYMKMRPIPPYIIILSFIEYNYQIILISVLIFAVVYGSVIRHIRVVKR
ncbi:hypothetical protein DMB44_02765 [Thermoplasma sp. Kam2015]|uniref:hypothetical protein n=1 Tax=Thermoplasma sp. Kam2015 TaxID=2094122 RepID=UPI000D8D643D|nr:hypothetical protein [Thermoplasma sp. Kam2015]PYB68804.1 hypothetical protein DMB44_02765 [Thermoplasma sp. Kam2015]